VSLLSASPLWLHALQLVSSSCRLLLVSPADLSFRRCVSKCCFIRTNLLPRFYYYTHRLIPRWSRLYAAFALLADPGNTATAGLPSFQLRSVRSQSLVSLILPCLLLPDRRRFHSIRRLLTTQGQCTVIGERRLAGVFLSPCVFFGLFALTLFSLARTSASRCPR
jgi:hypothetical protein